MDKKICDFFVELMAVCEPYFRVRGEVGGSFPTTGLTVAEAGLMKTPGIFDIFGLLTLSEFVALGN